MAYSFVFFFFLVYRRKTDVVINIWHLLAAFNDDVVRWLVGGCHLLAWSHSVFLFCGIKYDKTSKSNQPIRLDCYCSAQYGPPRPTAEHTDISFSRVALQRTAGTNVKVKWNKESWYWWYIFVWHDSMVLWSSVTWWCLVYGCNTMLIKLRLMVFWRFA